MKMTVVAKHFELDAQLQRYLNRKLDHLSRHIPRHARHSAHAEVVLTQQRAHATNPCQCEVILKLPQSQLVASEATTNMFAAVDIVEAKLKNQLLKYKAKVVEHDPWRSRVWRRMRIKGPR